jgi:WD40 repeat protein/cellulose biosynthesis protein BcsQ
VIVTFYSFKGGVGRSFSLVETALQLAGRGASVVVWDLDLEAPGLQKLPSLQILEEGLNTGTLDLLLEFQENDYTFPAPADFRRAIVLPEDLARPGGRLGFLLPARLDEDYPRKFSQVDWETQLSPNAAGAAFFHRAASLLNEEFDYVLIDSRTGFTPLSAVCSLQLPDLVILVFNYNEQNLAGIARVHQVITRTPARLYGEIPAILLANMVPKESSTLLKSKEETLRRLGLDNVLHTIPLRADLLLTDRLPSFDPSLDPDVRDARSRYGLLADDIETRRRDLEGDREKADREKLARAIAKGDREEIARLRRQGIYESALDFEDKVAKVFSLHDYQVTPHHRSADLEFDLRLEISRGLLPVVALVECRTGSGRITPQEIQETAKRVKTAGEAEGLPYQAMLIASSEPPAAVREVAIAERVHVQTYKQLLLSLIEPTALLDHAIRGLQGTALERLYVDLDVLMEDRRSGGSTELRELTPEISQWLRQPRAPVFVLLGEFGSGKTSFCRRFACQLALRAREEGSSGKLEGRIPIYIDLRDPSAAGTIENLLLQQVQRLSPKAVHPQAPMLLNREGRFVLLLDGFDEITGHTGPGQSLALLRQLLRAAEPQAKILITCRPHFFRDRPAEAPSEENAGRSSTRLYEEVRDRHHAAIGYVLDFRREKIQEYLQKAVPSPASWQQVEEKIRETPGLHELASRPFLLNLIVETLPGLSREGQAINLARLYEVYCQSWFEQADFRLTLDRAWRVSLVEQLARLVWDAPRGQIHAEVLTEKALELFRERGIPLKDPERIDGEIRTAPFLRRDPEGYYSFTHPTFLEFFVARSLREGIVLDDPSCLDLRRVSRQIAAFLEDWSEAGQIPRLVSSLLSRPCQSPRSENALLLLYFHARAAAGPLVGPGADDTQLEAVRAQLAGWRPKEIFLEGANLEGAALPGVDLQGAHLEKARLSQADLRHAVLAGAFLGGAILRFADCRDLCGDGADFTDADLDHLDGRGASFEKARFQGADLAFARLARAKLRGAAFDGATLTGVGILGAEMAAQEALREEVVASGKSSLTIRPQFGPSAPVTDLAWSHDGRCLAVLVDRKTVVVWDAESADRLLTFDRDDEQFLALAWGPRDLALASSRGRLLRWEPETDKIPVLAKVDGAVSCLSWSPEGRYLAMASRASRKSWEIHVLDLEDGGEARRLGEHTDTVTSLAWKPDGTSLASASLDRTVRFWELGGNESKPLKLRSADPIALRWSSDGRLLTVVFQGGRSAAVPLDGALDFDAIDLLPVGNVLPFQGSGPSADDRPCRMLWSPVDDLLAVAYGEGPAEIRRSTDAVTVNSLEGITSLPASFVSWSPDNRYLAAGFGKGGIHLWDLLAGSPVHPVEIRSGTALAAGWADEEGSLVVIRENLSLFTLDVGSGAASEIDSAMSGRTALLAAVSRDGRTVAASLDHYDSIAVRKGDGQWTRVPTEGTQVRALGLSFDGSDLAAACEDRVRLWEQETDRVLTLEGQDGHDAVCLAWSSDGQRLATGAADGNIRVWDVRNGRPLRSLSGHRKSILALAWSDFGRLASISKGRTLRVWDIEKGSSVQEVLGGNAVALVWPVPSRLLIVLEDHIEIWSPAPGRPQKVARLFALPCGPLAITEDGYVSGSAEALRTVRFGDRWALYDLDDVPERLSPEKVAAALLPIATGT